VSDRREFDRSEQTRLAQEISPTWRREGGYPIDILLFSLPLGCSAGRRIKLSLLERGSQVSRIVAAGIVAVLPAGWSIPMPLQLYVNASSRAEYSERGAEM
jgi:hypothetical protein